jgi:hypothetical protein
MLKILMLMVTKFGKTKGFAKFIAKHGKKSFDRIQTKLGPNTKFSEKTTKKSVTKSKPVKKVTEAQRVKEQIARDLKKKKTPNPRGKPTGSVVRNYRGKAEPTYQAGKKYKPYVPPRKP